MCNVLKLTLLAGLLIYSGQLIAALPEKCIQLPERTDVCPHLVYKKSPVKLVPFDVEKGQIACICMADFAALKFPAKSDIERTEQQVFLTRVAAKLALPEDDLMSLIRY